MVFKFMIVLLVVTHSIFAQKAKPKTADELKPLGRAKLIQMAVERIQSNYPQFNPVNFDRVNVYTEGGRLIVRFDVAVKFIPKNICAYYIVTAELTRGSLGMIPFGEVENCKDDNFYVINKNANDHIALIRKKLPGLIPEKIQNDEAIVIQESDTSYNVSMEGSSYSHGFKLDKQSFQKYDIFDGMKVPTKSTWIEIE